MGDEHGTNLTLYHRDNCPYCLRVERAVRELGIPIERKDIWRDPQAKAELRDARGRGTVPVLRIDEATGDDSESAGSAARWMPESRDIVVYLFERFGEGRRPGLRYGIFRRWTKVVFTLCGLLALAALLGPSLLGMHTLRAKVPPIGLTSSQPFPDAAFGALLARVARPEGVDYAALRRHGPTLRSYVATLAVDGPRTTPARFPTRAHRLAYAINAYNALALFGVLEHWPIATVHDVRGPIEPRAGFGFFWAQRFVLDGRTINLYALENEMRAHFGDARIHAAINCCSRSCPSLAATVYSAEKLEAQLDAAAQRFAGAELRHLRIDKARREIVLNAIYQWYAADFEAHAVQLGAGKSVLDWVAHYAAPERKKALAAARKAGYRLRHAPYDWRLNRVP